MDNALPIFISFFLGIATIWIKEAIAKKISINSKRKALKSLCFVEIDGIEVRTKYLADAVKRKISVYDHFHLPVAMKELLLELIRIDLKGVWFYNLMYGNFLVAQLLIDDIHNAVNKKETRGIEDLYEKLEYRLMCLASCCVAFIDGKYIKKTDIDEKARVFLRQLEGKYSDTNDPRFKELS